MGTFLYISDASNVRGVTAAIDGTEIHLSDSYFITSVSVSLEFSIFHELSNDKSKFVNRRIMTPSISMATVTWQYGPNGSNQHAAPLNFFAVLGDSRNKLSSAIFHNSADKFELPFGGIVAKDLSLDIQQFSPLIMGVSFNLFCSYGLLGGFSAAVLYYPLINKMSPDSHRQRWRW